MHLDGRWRRCGAKRSHMFGDSSDAGVCVTGPRPPVRSSDLELADDHPQGRPRSESGRIRCASRGSAHRARCMLQRNRVLGCHRSSLPRTVVEGLGVLLSLGRAGLSERRDPWFRVGDLILLKSRWDAQCAARRLSFKVSSPDRRASMDSSGHLGARVVGASICMRSPRTRSVEPGLSNGEVLVDPR